MSRTPDTGARPPGRFRVVGTCAVLTLLAAALVAVPVQMPSCPAPYQAVLATPTPVEVETPPGEDAAELASDAKATTAARAAVARAQAESDSAAAALPEAEKAAQAAASAVPNPFLGSWDVDSEVSRLQSAAQNDASAVASAQGSVGEYQTRLDASSPGDPWGDYSYYAAQLAAAQQDLARATAQQTEDDAALASAQRKQRQQRDAQAAAEAAATHAEQARQAAAAAATSAASALISAQQHLDDVMATQAAHRERHRQVVNAWSHRHRLAVAEQVAANRQVEACARTGAMHAAVAGALVAAAVAIPLLGRRRHARERGRSRPDTSHLAVRARLLRLRRRAQRLTTGPDRGRRGR